MQLEGLDKLNKKINDLFGNRTRDFPASVIMPQTTMLQRAPPYTESPNINAYRFHDAITWQRCISRNRVFSDRYASLAISLWDFYRVAKFVGVNIHPYDVVTSHSTLMVFSTKIYAWANIS
jgi:hypothetical protein